jgi:phage terminase large subunit
MDGDGRLHIAREYYKCGVIPENVVKESKKWYEGSKCDYAAVDEAAAGLIASMRNDGMDARPAKGKVLTGIQRVQNRLQIQGDGLPRLTVDPECVEVVNEFESYIWKPEKDEPLKEHDHAMDAIRYLIHLIDSGENIRPTELSLGRLGL